MERLSDTASYADLPPAGESVIVHSGPGWMNAIVDGGFDFFTKLESHAASHGRPMSVVLAGSEASEAALNRGGAHINIGGPARYHPGLLHAAPTYLWGFWYLDDLGVHWQSSIRLSDFPGEALPWDPSQYFFDGVAGHMLEHNVSKLPQPAREGLSPAFAAVFCQDIEDHWPRSHYLTTVEIIRNTARAAGGGRVYVKPHPHSDEKTRDKIEDLCKGDPNLMVSDASVHDLIAASAAVVTQNSAAGFEALLQHKPVVLCARADYHHAAVTAKTEDDLRAILRDVGGRTRHVDYHRYVAWFLNHRCFEPQAENFEARAWAKIMETATL